MPPIPSSSPITGKPVSDSYIHTTSCSFVDNHGRSLLLRGVNLSGASKAPVGHLSYLLEDFWESAEEGGESFTGRPLNIDDGTADVHLARLRGWGFNMLRFPFTWEALEHQGPGIYDTEFMDYTIRVLSKCRDYGFRVFMDPHQDTWSRFSGGSGAPYWTLAACGINPRNITATQAAIIHSEYPAAHDPDPANLPAMVWSTNYGRLLSQTVFTLFFAGRTFAPNCVIDGVNIQDYLQNHFIEACGRLADRIRAFDGGRLFDECIIGWDNMNEPFEGLCGWNDLQLNPTAQGSTLKKGTYPTPAQSLRLGMGQAQTVDNWIFGVTGPSKNGTVTIDPKGRKVWADHVAEGEVGEHADGTHPRWGWKRDVSLWTLGTCIWAQHGVWDVETGYILRPHYFRTHPRTGDEVEFLSDFWKPHWLAYATRIRQAHEEAIILVQPPVFAPPPRFEESELKGRCIYSPHYYDGLTLITRHWNWFNADALGLLRGKYSSTLQAVKIGEGAIRKSLHEQLGYLRDDVPALGNGDYPTLIGEIGTPFDMDNKRSYGWTDGGKYKGDYSAQEKALDASLAACDAWKDDTRRPSLSWTVWTYVPDDHEHEWGDGWNMEDLSLWSPDDLHGDTDDEYDDEDGSSKEESVVAHDDALHSRAKLLGPPGGRKLRKLPPRMLRPPIPPARRMRTISDASRDTMSIASDVAPANRAGYSPNPYTLLTNGARAVRAFARPWPISVVGQGTDVRFDIKKALFRMTVSVAYEDRLQNLRGEELATEVYLPLVHYAHPRLLEEAEQAVEKRRDQRRAWRQARGAGGDTQSVVSVTTLEEVDIRGRTRISSGVRPGGVGLGIGVQPLTLSMVTNATTSTATASTTLGSPTSDKHPGEDKCAEGCAPLLVSDDTPDLVDVLVTVSSGRTEVRGQKLFWWYDVPEEGAPPVEYTLEVQRRGGVLPVPGSRKLVATDDKSGGWCDQLCREDGVCVIA